MANAAKEWHNIRLKNNPKSRSVEELIENGFILLDKWPGPTSRDAVDIIKKLLGARLGGHLGTLDPRVSGVLPITLGRACKVISILQGLDKEYVGILRLHEEVVDDNLRKVLTQFTGEINQRPPVHAAVARNVRKRKIYSIEILDRKENFVCLRVSCEAGTYIRKLFHDIGQALGTGAHMSELRRTQVGPWNEKSCATVQELIDAVRLWKKSNDECRLREILIPIENALKALPEIKSVYIKDSAIVSVKNGSPIFTSGIYRSDKDIEKDDDIAIYSLSGELKALGTSKMTSEEISQKRGLAIKVNRVI